MYKRVLLKLSGEALSSKDEIFSSENLDDVALQIKEMVNLGVEVGVVTGGGNIYRGKLGETLGMDRVTGDSIGMLATVMNVMALSNSLTKVGVKNKVLTSIEMSPIAKMFTTDRANKYLEKGFVVLYGGGTGSPYFSTDTCAALRALETNCEAILMAKNGVEGVYDDDPIKNKNAKLIENLSYLELIEKQLKVMDHTACSLCMEKNIPLLVFNMNTKGNILKVCKGEKIGTIIK